MLYECSLEDRNNLSVLHELKYIFLKDYEINSENINILPVLFLNVRSTSAYFFFIRKLMSYIIYDNFTSELQG